MVLIVCCAAEPPRLSGVDDDLKSPLSDAGAVSVARALERNTTLKELTLTSRQGEFVVAFLFGGLIVFYVV